MTLLKTGVLQNAIFNSAHFSCIATDEKGVIQLFNVGAERMLGYGLRRHEQDHAGRVSRSARGNERARKTEKTNSPRRLRRASMRWSSRLHAVSRTTTN